MDETSPKTSSSDLDYAEALDLLYGRINYERLAAGAKPYRFKLTRIRVLLDELGLGKYLYPKPDDASRPTRPPVPLIHLAGTKGKGSTATMVASCLSAAGYRTGLYTSPHLHLLEERFRVDLQPCSAGELCQLINRIAPVVESMSERSVGAPTFLR